MKRTGKSLISVQRKPKRFTTSQSKVQGLASLLLLPYNSFLLYLQQRYRTPLQGLQIRIRFNTVCGF